MQTLALLLLAAPVPQASELVASHVLATNATPTRVVDTLAHATEGALLVAALGGNGSTSLATQLLVQHVDENGDVLWTTDVTQGVQGNGWFDPIACATEDGGAALAIERSNGFLQPTERRIVRLEPNGQIRWSVLLSSLAPSDFHDIGVSESGHILLGGTQRTGFGPVYGSLVSHDDASGAEQWLVHLATDGDARVLVEGGLAYIGRRTSPFEGDLSCVDGSGAAIYNRLEPLEFEGQILPLDADDTGRSFVRVSWGGQDLYQELDPTGEMSWSTRNLPGTDQDDIAGTFVLGGGAVVVAGPTANNGPAEIGRADATGAILWNADLPPLTLPSSPRVVEVAPDRIAVPGSLPVGFTAQRQAGATFYDALDGTILETLILPSPGSPDDLAAAVARDARGNTWIGSTRSDGLILQAHVERYVSLGDPSTLGCTPSTPNSVGRLSRLITAGTADATSDNLTLVAYDLPGGVTTLFVNGSMPAFVPNAGGSQGTLCLGGSLGRYMRPGQVRAADVAGRAALQLDLAETPSGNSFVSITAGLSVYFQAWHRDTVGGMATSNFSNSVRVDFQ